MVRPIPGDLCWRAAKRRTSGASEAAEDEQHRLSPGCREANLQPAPQYRHPYHWLQRRCPAVHSYRPITHEATVRPSRQNLHPLSL
ncbi:hypothetical protein FOQG_19432 [Fusarium oxysporum f. sp. raphani 54005]|uniref:Uncharacterized protein n=1 Tax=Fusarium oxysporum f. sp. raphani 54005 TaxID=1089458 RepID=X0BAF9_FUSOX|nr:hypothetical protein FOQG_19432 [Fusarium oxysporum f. sp. raphani 54005]